MSGPLSGIKVVDLTINVAGPLSTQILGDMGADVIKVETPQGDMHRYFGPTRNSGMSAYFMNLNRNKRSVVLRLREASGREALMRLVETADVFVHSMRTRAAERLGIGYGAIGGRNQRIIYSAITGYRQDGPNRDRAAYDDVIQGESGISGMMRRTTGEARYVPFNLVDKFLGYVQASVIGMALYERERTGKGQRVHVPMFETMLSFNLLEHLWGATYDPPAREGIGYPRTFSRHHRPYATRDGYISLLAHADDQWRRLFDAIGKPELALDERFKTVGARTEHIDELYGMVAEAVSERTTSDWRLRLDAADIPNGPARDLEQILADPYVIQTEFFRRYSHPTEGAVVNMKVPYELSRTPGSVRRLAPSLGEHSVEVLSELGYTPDEITKLSAI